MTNMDEEAGSKLAVAAGDKIIEAIRVEGRETREEIGKDFKELSTEIRELTKVIVKQGAHLGVAAMTPVANNGGQKWAIATFLTVIAALSTVVGSEIANQRRERALIEAYQITARDSADEAQRARIAFLEGVADEHSGLNAAQWERIKGLERAVWGEPGDVPDDMEAGGADQ